jgi:hypothetical protein
MGNFQKYGKSKWHHLEKSKKVSKEKPRPENGEKSARPSWTSNEAPPLKANQSREQPQELFLSETF